MLSSSYPELTCSIARALEVVGERWSLLIVRDALRGTSRFEEFQSSLGIARNVLSARLDRLVREGVLERRLYGAGRRTDYQLSDKGRHLGTALVALMQWGDRYYPALGGPPRLITHSGCGGAVQAILSCQEDNQDITAENVTISPGPGHGSLPREQPVDLARRLRTTR